MPETAAESGVLVTRHTDMGVVVDRADPEVRFGMKLVAEMLLATNDVGRLFMDQHGRVTLAIEAERPVYYKLDPSTIDDRGTVLGRRLV